MIVKIVMGNQYLYVMCNILNRIKILTRTLYLMLSPLIEVKILLIVKVMNIFWKEVTNKIAINPLKCMLILQNIKSKI